MLRSVELTECRVDDDRSHHRVLDFDDDMTVIAVSFDLLLVKECECVGLNPVGELTDLLSDEPALLDRVFATTLARLHISPFSIHLRVLLQPQSARVDAIEVGAD